MIANTRAQDFKAMPIGFYVQAQCARHAERMHLITISNGKGTLCVKKEALDNDRIQ